uniref:Toprim domain-containing protein n=1 Tax=Candidatus Kentrum sp. TUN TaxID=2126343 RepID=A0A450ZK78_9GAMM|nr:MAG: Toprim domain-containing protein [Candidatus Kentron sp. TUN]
MIPQQKGRPVATQPATIDHPYLIRKGIRVPSENRVRQCRELLVLPVMDFKANLTSLQFIAPNANKRLLSGGRKRDCFIPVQGDIANPSKVVIYEGWATGCTLFEDEPESTILAAIDAGNLKPVAINARNRWPFAELVIAGDDDRKTPGNPGATKAKEAAIASDALLAFPQWPEGAPDTLTDFNDLVQWQRGAHHE